MIEKFFVRPEIARSSASIRSVGAREKSPWKKSPEKISPVKKVIMKNGPRFLKKPSLLKD